MARRVCRAVSVLALFLAAVAPAAAAVRVRFDPNDPRSGPFPSDRLTVADRRQNTGRRVNLLKPPCGERPSDCADIDVINTLDGFNVQPRLTIPFDGPIDVSTVSSRTIFLLNLGSTPPGRVVGIDQVVWDPTSFTLHAEAEELLEPHTRYLLIVTDGVRDAAGQPLEPAPLLMRESGQAPPAAAAGQRIVAASLFTTQSTTSTLEQIRDQIKAATPAPASFLLGADGARTVFPASTVAGIVFQRQVGAASFVPVPVPTAALSAIPGAVGSIAFGRYASPDYETAAGVIPPTPTRSGVPAVQRVGDVFFTLFLPAGQAPAGGWPVALFGHGLGENKNGSPFMVAATLAAGGIATIAINAVGHGGGPAGTLTVDVAGGSPVTVPAGGRAVDQNGDGRFDVFEGLNAQPPQTIVSSRDGLRQTVVDLMQLVRVIEVGMDVDGDSRPDLDPSKISYAGQSFGGIYGTLFLAVEPGVPAGVSNVGGGALVEVSRLGNQRPVLAGLLAARTPSLLNLPAGFDESIPLRGRPAVVAPAPGAVAIQEFVDRMEWVAQAANPAAYARHLRAAPLPGMPAKQVLFQLAKGDQTVPNPTTTAVLRAGRLADRATYFRNDLAFAADPSVPKNPHSFLTRLTVPSVAAVAFAAQRQVATFLASGGAVIVDPDGAGPLFEVPIVPPLPEDLSFIP